ncbi:MAG: hypothetical protein KBB83_07730 [Alphaproteobacteria bacterium]|nr:hypothetical protein [Alphaproteobacteria bacterium]
MRYAFFFFILTLPLWASDDFDFVPYEKSPFPPTLSFPEQQPSLPKSQQFAIRYKPNSLIVGKVFFYEPDSFGKASIYLLSTHKPYETKEEFFADLTHALKVHGAWLVYEAFRQQAKYLVAVDLFSSHQEDSLDVLRTMGWQATITASWMQKDMNVVSYELSLWPITAMTEFTLLKAKL